MKQEQSGAFIPNVFICRIGSSMYFANASYIKDPRSVVPAGPGSRGTVTKMHKPPPPPPKNNKIQK
eukprot:2811926-Amphidinium_carterae.1